MIFNPHRPGGLSNEAAELPPERLGVEGSSAGGNPLLRFLREFFLLDDIDFVLTFVIKF